MRLTGNNTEFRNPNNTLHDRIWINMTNNEGLFRQLLIGFFDQATNNYDRGIDGKRMENGNNFDFYSLINNTRYVIQGFPILINEKIIPIGIEAPSTGSFQISIDHLEGDLENVNVYLKDNLLNTLTNLTEGEYTFTSNESNQKDRFVIIFSEEQLGINDANLESISLYPNPTNNILNIVSPLSTITNVAIYDLRGRMISTVKVANQSSYQLDMYDLETAMYFVKVTTDSGILTERVIRE
jgi:hypothetical protein